MKDRTKIEEKLRKELERNILLPEEEKSFWLSKTSSLPEEILLNVLKSIESKNKITDEYTLEALRKDPDKKILNEFKSQISKIKRDAVIIEERTEKSGMEDDFDQILQDI